MDEIWSIYVKVEKSNTIYANLYYEVLGFEGNILAKICIKNESMISISRCYTDIWEKTNEIFCKRDKADKIIYIMLTSIRFSL